MAHTVHLIIPQTNESNHVVATESNNLQVYWFCDGPFYLYCLLRYLLNRPESAWSVNERVQASQTAKHLAAIEVFL